LIALATGPAVLWVAAVIRTVTVKGTASPRW
jgi:hypothetical protein